MDTSKMAGKSHPCLEVRQGDLAVADLGTSEFDLVNARAVMMWVPERENLVRRSFEALRPGGWMVIDDGWQILEADPSTPSELADTWRYLQDQIGRQQRELTGMKTFGKEAFGVLRTVGFVDVDARGVIEPTVGGTPRARFRKETMRSSMAGLAARGIVDRAELEPMLDVFDRPEFAMWQAINMQVWGRKPA
jgi:SAM-dependent methyltransferase